MSLKFVSLHNHDGQSIYDAIGSPADYADWVIENAGEDSGAFAITNHGNMNSVGSIAAIQEKYNKKGVRILYGVEAYYIPSIEHWYTFWETQKEEKKARKEDGDLVIEDDESKIIFDKLNRKNHLVLVAANQKGLENLFILVSRSYRYGMYRKPRIDLAMLKEFNEGLIVSTACLGGIPAWCLFNPENERLDKINLFDEQLGPLIEIFGKDRFFLELQFNKYDNQKKLNLALIDYSLNKDLNLIVAADSHYPRPEMWKDREIYKMLGYQMNKTVYGTPINQLKREDQKADLYLKNGDQIFEVYKDTFRNDLLEFYRDGDLIIKDAITRTYDIAHNYIQVIFPDNTIKLPKTFQVTKDIKTPFDKLSNLCTKSLSDKKLFSKEYIDRLAFELKVIKDLGVEEYFLAMKKILDILRKEMLIGCGRGSGCGSLVNYLLDITMLDPLKHGLLFERFLSPNRAEMPDVDSDVELKEESLDILKQYFGDEDVVAISNYNRLQLKSLIKDIARLSKIEFEEVNAVTKVIENEAKPNIMKEIGGDQKLYELTFEKAFEHSPTFQDFLKKNPIGEHISNLFNEVKSISRHAGGVLIVPEAEKYLPIIRIRKIDQSPIVEGITAQHLKQFGLVKFDILGLATLKIIRRCIEEILRNNNESVSIKSVWEFYNKHLHPDKIIDSGGDSEVFKFVFNKARFPNIFQFTEKGVQSFAKKAKPKNIFDIAALTALWRPGPLHGHADQRYLHHKPTDIKREHPVIQEILGPTRGLLLFQEQFMLLANKLAGFSLEEADYLRKLLVRPSTSLADEIKKERIEYGVKFINGCIEKGMSEKRAQSLWDNEIMGFISYGFNKSHATAYAYTSYQCAWLFYYHPKEWIKACLECTPDLQKTINSIRSIGFFMDNPDINICNVDEWEVREDLSCLPSLVSLKGIGYTAAEELLRVRNKVGQFTDINNFLFDDNGNWRWSKFNKRSLEILILMEAFASLKCVGGDRLFSNYKHMYDAMFFDYKKLKGGKITLEECAKETVTEDWPISVKMAKQKAIVGFFNKAILVGEFIDMFEEFGISAIDETPDERDKQKIWGVVETIVQKKTKTDKPYLVVTASGMSDKTYTFKVWNKKREKDGDWSEGNVLVFGLEYDKEWGYNFPRYNKVLKVTK